MFAHFRPFLFVFIGLIIGLLAGYMLFYVYSIGFYISVGLCALVLVLVIISVVLKNKKFFKYIFNNKHKFICIILCVILGASVFVIMHSTYKPEYNFNKNQDYYVVATIKTNYSYKNDDENQRLTFLINNAQIIDGSNTVILKKNLYVSVKVNNFTKENILYNISVNDDIVLHGRFSYTPVFGERFYEYAYKNNFEYMVYTNQDDVILYNKQPMGIDAVRESIHNTLFSNMDEKYASLAYSVLIGDRTGLDDEIEYNLKATGLAHIVAVSGLHIGFLVVLLLGFCKLCRIRKGWIQFLLASVVLLFYCLLCNFTPSVVRASVMAICLLSAKAFKKQSDSLSSVSLAGIIILLFRPLYVFDLSFQLSFAAVFAIILLFPLFKSCYNKLENKKVATKCLDTINLSLTAQIGTVPFIIKNFNYISTFSLIANVVIIPLFGFVYMILFVITLLSLILPFLSVLLYVPELCFTGLNYITSFIANIPFSVLTVKSLLPITLFLFMITMFVISDKCILQKKAKLICSISTVCVFVVALVLNIAL